MTTELRSDTAARDETRERRRRIYPVRWFFQTLPQTFRRHIRQFYLSTPVALEEAAMMDGASRWRIFTSIFLPQSLAPFVVVGVASFLGYWNAYVWPILTIQSPELTQIMQYLGNFRSERGNEWGLLMAGSILAALPTILLVLVFQRWIVNGVRISGLK